MLVFIHTSNWHIIILLTLYYRDYPELFKSMIRDNAEHRGKVIQRVVTTDTSTVAAAAVRSRPGTMLEKAALDTDTDIIVNPTSEYTTKATQPYLAATDANEEKYIAIVGDMPKAKDDRDEIVNDVSDAPLPKEYLIHCSLTSWLSLSDL